MGPDYRNWGFGPVYGLLIYCSLLFVVLVGAPLVAAFLIVSDVERAVTVPLGLAMLLCVGFLVRRWLPGASNTPDDATGPRNEAAEEDRRPALPPPPGSCREVRLPGRRSGASQAAIGAL